jgi:peptidoglycan-associated lipoprotein
MTSTSTLRIIRTLSLAFVFATLAACATTQKSSTSSAEQNTPTRPNESAPQTAAKAAAPLSNAGPTEQAVSKPAQSTTDSIATSSGDTNSSASGNTTHDAPASSASENAADVKRALAEEDAELNKLRERQQAAAEQTEKEPTQPPPGADQTATQQAGQSAPPAKAKVVPNAKSDEESMVFPAAVQSAAAAQESAEAVPQTLERSVFFNYNEASVLQKYDAMLLANAARLKAHPNITVEVQGNCDERGSREYNLALGARRAEVVKRALELGGADGRHIRTVSFGKEKPIATGTDEESYSKNRRADIVY